MKKLILAASITCFILLLYSCGRKSLQQISFAKNNDKTIKQVLAEAKKQKKIVFVDVYTTWCGPCKWMDKNTFRDTRVGEKFNKTFFNYKVDGDSFEGVNIGITYKIDSYPTYLFIGTDGRVIHRIEGSISAESLIEEADFVVNRNLQYLSK